MSKPHIYRPQLYRMLRNFRDEDLELKILDCGAGGRVPPLSLFQAHGFETYGIDISQEEIDKANNYCKEHNIEVNIQLGDMRKIPFEDKSFSFVYSINSIYHLTKKDHAIAIQEMERVVKPGGYLYADFLSIDDGNYGEGRPVDSDNETGEFYQKEHGGEVIHSYFKDGEPDAMFTSTEIVLKNKTNMWVKHEGKIYKPSFTEYYSQKPV